MHLILSIYYKYNKNLNYARINLRHPETTINYYLPSSNFIKLNIYNIEGQKVKTLYNGYSDFGYHQINWDGKNPRKVKLLYVPKHVPLEIGYSVITSSFDSIFPKGIEIGKISNINKEINSNFYDLDILLSEDFYSIYNVYLVKSFPFEEKIGLENID